MKRSKWPLVIGALVVGALAGAALAGRPESLPSVVVPASTAAETTTTVEATTSSEVRETTTSATEASTTTVAPSAPVQQSTTVPTSQVNLIVVNGTGRPGMASRAADVLLAAGWVVVGTDDARNPVAVTRVLAKPGFEAAAQQAITELGLTATVEPFTTDIATIGEAEGDVMVFLGADVNF